MTKCTLYEFDLVEIYTYQYWEQMLAKNPEWVMREWKNYRYIVLDEIQHVNDDAEFIENTDLLYDAILKARKFATVIAMTATPGNLFTTWLADGLLMRNRYYRLPKKMSHFTKAYVYSRDCEMVNILENLPAEEKALVFMESHKELERMKARFGDCAAYYCSSNNAKGKMDKLDDCLKDGKLQKQILFATIALYNGINIKDRSLKHIFIESWVPSRMIQMQGRKRPLDAEDTCTVYYRSPQSKMGETFEKKERRQLISDLELVDAWREREHGNPDTWKHLKLSISQGWETDYPDTWLQQKAQHGKQRFQVRYNAQAFAVLAEQALKEAGVKILYGTTVCQVQRSGKRITYLIVENKSGRFAIPVRSAVDATGDADVFRMAGAPTAAYEKGNLPAAWFYETKNGSNTLHMLGAADILPDDQTAKIPDKLNGRRISGLDADELSEAVIVCHKQSLHTFLQDGPVSEQHSLTALATIPQLRMTRRIRGVFTQSEADCQQNFADSIGMVGDWRKAGPVYEVSLRTLYTAELENCMAAGRIISVTDGLWDVTRVIPAAAVTGQAAGLAMALTDNIHDLDTMQLQQNLYLQNVKLHFADVGL